jgi:hypothetical protein
VKKELRKSFTMKERKTNPPISHLKEIGTLQEHLKTNILSMLRKKEYTRYL